jgi:hypothetical protein
MCLLIKEHLLQVAVLSPSLIAAESGILEFSKFLYHKCQKSFGHFAWQQSETVASTEMLIRFVAAIAQPV